MDGAVAVGLPYAGGVLERRLSLILPAALLWAMLWVAIAAKLVQDLSTFAGMVVGTLASAVAFVPALLIFNRWYAGQRQRDRDSVRKMHEQRAAGRR